MENNNNVLPDDEEVVPVDPLEARAAFVLRIEQIQRNLAGLAILKASDSHRQRIEPLREEIDSFKTQLGEIDSIIAYTPSVVSMRGQNSSANTPSLPYSAALPGLPLNSGNGVSRADFKLPTNLPELSSVVKTLMTL